MGRYAWDMPAAFRGGSQQLWSTTMDKNTRLYDEAKRESGGALCLFKMGDFYEAFYDDAAFMARKLGLTLTTRGRGADALPMSGFPCHQFHAYKAKLMALGLRVATIESLVEGRELTIFDEFDDRCRALEAEGMTRSDAQGIVMAQDAGLLA